MVMALPKLEDASALEPTLRQTRVGRADFSIDLASGRWRSQIPKRTRVTSFVVPNMRQAHCFLQRDPIGIRGGFNVYTYVRNDPTIAIDPTGLFPLPGFAPVPTPRPVDLANIFLLLTGGQDSWLDNPTKVKQAQDALMIPAFVCVVVLAPGGAAGRIIAGSAVGIAKVLG